MNKILIASTIAIILSCQFAMAQDVTTVTSTSAEIGQNLDLEAVASVFGDSENLEDFENRLNDPELQISNLDLNEDGEVDYLRVLNTSSGETQLVTVQAVIGDDLFQDVAVIDVERDPQGETTVQVVGDVAMYGPNVVVTPVYVKPPVVVVWFYSPMYSPWRSPYRWGYYPPYYRPRPPHPTPYYHTNVRVNVNVNNTYHQNVPRSSQRAGSLQSQQRRSDAGTTSSGRSQGATAPSRGSSAAGNTDKSRSNGAGNATKKIDHTDRQHTAPSPKQKATAPTPQRKKQTRPAPNPAPRPNRKRR